MLQQKRNCFFLQKVRSKARCKLQSRSSDLRCKKNFIYLLRTYVDATSAPKVAPMKESCSPKDYRS
jgi:hypothetical protein